MLARGRARRKERVHTEEKMLKERNRVGKKKRKRNTYGAKDPEKRAYSNGVGDVM